MEKQANVISFIIIGRNEGWKLIKCFDSIFNTIKENSIKKYEITYIDSNSTDSSVKNALGYPNIKVIKLTDKYNAAIGRNIGVKESIGEILYFIDGDMEILPGFLEYVLINNFRLKYDFVSGIHKAVNYDSDGNMLGEKIYGKGNLNKDEYFAETGGIFMIKRDIWESVNGMKNKFKKSQDIDLALRLAKKGVLLLRKKEIMNKHFTIPYDEKKRMWQILFSKNIFYSNGLLIREHLFNKYLYKRLLRQNSTFVILLFSIIGSLVLKTYYLFPLYVIAIIIRSIRRNGNTFKLVPYLILKDLITLYSFCFFHPKNIRTEDIKYEIIESRD